MMLWAIQEPKTSKRRKASGWNVTGNPLDPIKAFVSQCKTQGMTYQETIAAVEEKFNYFPTEAEIVVRDFWK